MDTIGYVACPMALLKGATTLQKLRGSESVEARIEGEAQERAGEGSGKGFGELLLRLKVWHLLNFKSFNLGYS